jgi:CobQ-like glutamine amidotransferase family enzyme
MNMYGDTGNSLALKKRFEMYGLKARIVRHDVGDKLPANIDIIVAGGGQDSSQYKVHDDLLKNGANIKEMAEAGVPMLTICGMYQLFGNYFKTIGGDTLEGISVFDVHTIGKDERLIGNIITESKRFGKLIGYENHSGQTFLGENSTPLAERVVLGAGNNALETSEGCVFNNAIGTYLHGPLLPKNPSIADFLIRKAVSRKVGYDVCLTSQKVRILDEIANHARKFVAKR